MDMSYAVKAAKVLTLRRNLSSRLYRSSEIPGDVPSWIRSVSDVTSEIFPLKSARSWSNSAHHLGPGVLCGDTGPIQLLGWSQR